MMKLIDSALEDTLFIRLIYLVCSLPFYAGFAWVAIRENFFLDTPLLLVITISLALACLAFFYLVFFAKHKTPFNSTLIDGGFWIIFIIVVIALLPFWLILRNFRPKSKI